MRRVSMVDHNLNWDHHCSTATPARIRVDTDIHRKSIMGTANLCTLTRSAQHQAPFPDSTSSSHTHQRLPGSTRQHYDPWPCPAIAKHLTKTLFLRSTHNQRITSCDQDQKSHDSRHVHHMIKHSSQMTMCYTWYGLSRVVGFRSILKSKVDIELAENNRELIILE